MAGQIIGHGHQVVIHKNGGGAGAKIATTLRARLPRPLHAVEMAVGFTVVVAHFVVQMLGRGGGRRGCAAIPQGVYVDIGMNLNPIGVCPLNQPLQRIPIRVGSLAEGSARNALCPRLEAGGVIGIGRAPHLKEDDVKARIGGIVHHLIYFGGAGGLVKHCPVEAGNPQAAHLHHRPRRCGRWCGRGRWRGRRSKSRCGQGAFDVGQVRGTGGVDLAGHRAGLHPHGRPKQQNPRQHKEEK